MNFQSRTSRDLKQQEVGHLNLSLTKLSQTLTTLDRVDFGAQLKDYTEQLAPTPKQRPVSGSFFLLNQTQQGAKV